MGCKVQFSSRRKQRGKVVLQMIKDTNEDFFSDMLERVEQRSKRVPETINSY